MGIVFSLFLIPIMVSDLRNHVVPNIYVKILAYLMFVSFVINGLPRAGVFLACLLMVTVFLLTRVGMGDIKLLTILVLTFSCQILPFLTLVSTAAIAHIVISTVRFRAVPLSIPLAPAIFFGFTTYLATR